MAEQDLYRPVQDYLEERFQDRLKPARGDLRHLTEITDRAGGVATGTWSKPDLALIALWRFKYSLSWNFDLHGFEVKPEKCDLTAVHEALNHTSQVHFAHLVWQVSDWSDSDARCKAIKERCDRHGVGLITFADPKNLDTFVVRASARRHEPDGEAVDEFIETRFSPEQREKLAVWIKELR